MTTVTFDTLSEILEVNLKDLVTKEDLHRELQQLEQRMIIKLGSLLVLALGVFTAIVKLT